MNKSVSHTTPTTPEKKTTTPTPPSTGAKIRSVMEGSCHAGGCKKPEARFTFCGEHYEQFKFGLIKKSGDPVSDYEKKFEHYQAYLARQKTQKAA